MVKLITEDVKHLNALLGTKFKKVNVIATNQRFNPNDPKAKYNVDIIIQSVESNRKFIIEVDGVFYHGLITDSVELKGDSGFDLK